MTTPKRLSDIPVAPPDLLTRLAADKPEEAEKDAYRGMPGGENGPQSGAPGGRKTPRGGPGRDLGPLDVGAYLSHYGKGYQAKPGRDGATLYTLFECVFDSNHGPNEAAIVQTASGTLYYQCFHDSCQGRTWREAREKISGQDSLAQFCEGYDPNFKPRKKSDKRYEPARSCELDNLAAVHLPLALPDQVTVRPPDKVDPRDFFILNPEKNRLKFSYQRMAKYLSYLFAPICYSNNNFYRYCNGVWSIYPKEQIAKAATMAMGDEISTTRLTNALEVMKHLLFRAEEDWPEQDINLLNCKNGMLDLRTYELRPHHPDYGCRTQIAAAFDMDAEAENFYRVLEQIFPGEESVVDGKRFQGKIRMVQEMFGYALWPTCRLETAFFLYGSGANGKGTVCDALAAVLGEDNISSLSLEDLAAQFRVQMLQNRLVNYSGENPDRKALPTDVLKRAISGEMITVEQKYGVPFQFKPYCTFIFSMNMAPTITDKSYGFARRIVFIKFNQSFKGKDRDPSIKDKIGEEASGILNFALSGLEDIRRRQGFYTTEVAEQEKAEFMGRLNPVLQFAAECLDFVGSDDAYEFTEDVFQAYRDWCRMANHQPQSRTKFNEQLEQNFNIAKRRKTKKRRQAWAGVLLRLDAINTADQ